MQRACGFHVVVLCALGIAACVPSTSQEPSQTLAEPDTAWRITQLVGAPVWSDGNGLGRVADLIVLLDAPPEAVATGRFTRIHAVQLAGIGERTLTWNSVTLGPDLAWVRSQVPPNREQTNRYRTAQNPIRATELIGDRVDLVHVPRFGRIDDLLFTRDGRIRAAIIDAGPAIPGLYAVPWRLVDVDPDGERIQLALTLREIDQ